MDGLAGGSLLVSAAALGLLVGALFAEGVVLVPFWRSLAPTEFLAWYAANAARLLAFFSPLTVAAAVLAVAAALLSWLTGHPGRAPAAVAAVLTLLVVASYFVYFEHANASFAHAAILPGQVPRELARWAWWHWGRTVIGGVAFAAALLALARRGM